MRPSSRNISRNPPLARPHAGTLRSGRICRPARNITRWSCGRTDQIHFDPDTFGDYWSGFSPENPNFATVWWRPIYWDAAKLAEARLREDLYHSVTLPGGAGQECPGYMSHSMGCWRDLATHCRTHLGCDPTAWPQWKAAGAFHLHASQPMGDGTRHSHPGGDTHPRGPGVFALAKSYGVEEDIATFVTEANGSKDNQGTYTLRLRRDGDLYTGDFEGAYGGNPVKGQLTGKYVRAAFPLQIAYSPDPPPAVTPIPGGIGTSGR